MYNEMSPLSKYSDEQLCGDNVSDYDLFEEIILFRKALRYCLAQQGDDNCWMDYRHLLMRFLPGYDPDKDDIVLAENQLENCKNFIRCWQTKVDWDCLGGDKGKTVPARSIGTLECLNDK